MIYSKFLKEKYLLFAIRKCKHQVVVLERSLRVNGGLNVTPQGNALEAERQIARRPLSWSQKQRRALQSPREAAYKNEMRLRRYKATRINILHLIAKDFTPDNPSPHSAYKKKHNLELPPKGKY